jgi:hypothetical protein
LNFRSGSSENSGSWLSEKSSVRPKRFSRPVASTSRILRPPGAKTAISLHGSPSRKTWSPASPSVELTSMIIVASSRRIGFAAAFAPGLPFEVAAAIPTSPAIPV